MTTLTPDHIATGFVIACSRCANEEFSYSDHRHEALADFTRAGWAATGSRTYCPACEGSKP